MTVHVHENNGEVVASDTFTIPATNTFYVAGDEVSEAVYRRHALAVAVAEAADHFYTFPLDGQASDRLGTAIDAWDQRYACSCGPSDGCQRCAK